jgi:hypothetical protein
MRGRDLRFRPTGRDRFVPAADRRFPMPCGPRADQRRPCLVRPSSACSGLHDQGPDRHGKADECPDRSPACKPDRAGSSPAEAGNGAGRVAVALSGIVRWGSVRTAMNGTIVARPAGTPTETCMWTSFHTPVLGMQDGCQAGPHGRAVREEEHRLIDDPAHRALLVADRLPRLDADAFGLEAERIRSRPVTHSPGPCR